MVCEVGYVPELNVRSTREREMASETEAETEMSRDKNTKAVDGGCTVDTRERQKGLGRRMLRGRKEGPVEYALFE